MCRTANHWSRVLPLNGCHCEGIGDCAAVDPWSIRAHGGTVGICRHARGAGPVESSERLRRAPTGGGPVVRRASGSSGSRQRRNALRDAVRRSQRDRDNEPHRTASTTSSTGLCLRSMRGRAVPLLSDHPHFVARTRTGGLWIVQAKFRTSAGVWHRYASVNASGRAVLFCPKPAHSGPIRLLALRHSAPAYDHLTNGEPYSGALSRSTGRPNT